MSETTGQPSPTAETLVTIALEAGEAILTVYAGAIEVTRKADESPVTAADHAAEAVIVARLHAAFPGVPVVAEEGMAAGDEPKDARRFFLVDPLDGTKEFISRNGEFTVNIALIDGGEPVAGVVYAPAIGRLFWGEKGKGAGEARVKDGKVEAATWRALSVCERPARPRVVASRSHLDDHTRNWLDRLGDCEIVSAGSSLKFCLVAAGEADLYPRFGRTMEWDTAAGHAVLAAAGGEVNRAEGGRLSYGKRDHAYANPAFIASGQALNQK
ncbi:MAG: 3'(2'),5'-bisphosphate nucleotidase CysQ [Hyphomicrobiales bacterium]